MGGGESAVWADDVTLEVFGRFVEVEVRTVFQAEFGAASGQE
jgi:hypothetical protein